MYNNWDRKMLNESAKGRTDNGKSCVGRKAQLRDMEYPGVVGAAGHPGTWAVVGDFVCVFPLSRLLVQLQP